MHANQNPQGSRAPPTTGMNTPSTANQAPPGACKPNQQCQPPNQIQRICFEGAISELHGHIYDLVRICSADLFTTTI